MIKTVQLEGHSIEVNSSMGWLFVYRERFGHDITSDLIPFVDAILTILTEMYENGDEGIINSEIADEIVATLSGFEMTTLINILWAMAKNNDPNTKDPIEFANQFEVFPMDTVIKELGTLIIESSVSTKNSQSLLEKIKESKLALIPSSSAAQAVD